jgi:hypothetical protein
MFGPETVRTLRRYLPQPAIARLVRDVGRELARPELPHITRGKVREQATAIGKAAAELDRLIATSCIAGSLTNMRHLDRREGSESPVLDVKELGHQLKALSRACQSMLDMTGDSTAVPQLRFPKGGDFPDYRAMYVAEATLFVLYESRVNIGTGETGPAVECLTAVFDAAGIRADARRQVREFVRRNGLAKRRSAKPG